MGAAAFAMPIIPSGKQLGFKVLRNGTVIGEHHLNFSGTAENPIVDINIALAVKFAGITVFTYALTARETWEDGGFSHVHSTINNNGAMLEVEAHKVADGYLVTGTNHSDPSKSWPQYTAPPDTLPLTYWNKQMLNGNILNIQTAHDYRVTVNSPGLEQLRQRVIATQHLDAMETEEVGAYVEHRLTHVGWKGRPAFAPGVHARLAQASGCVPRRVNQLVNRLLLLGAVEHADTIDLDMLDEVIADFAEDAGHAGGASDAGHEGGTADGAIAAPEPAEFATPDDHAETHRQPEAPAGEHAANMAGITQALARELAARDEQIAELQQAVMELAEMRSPAAAEADDAPAHGHDHAPDHEPVLAAIAGLTQRIEALEVRTSDQNEAIRHVLTMLIEWLEAENASVRAA